MASTVNNNDGNGENITQQTPVVPLLNLSSTTNNSVTNLFSAKNSIQSSTASSNTINQNVKQETKVNSDNTNSNNNKSNNNNAMISKPNSNTNNNNIITRPTLTSLQQTTSNILKSKMNIKSTEISKINTQIKNQYLKTLTYKQKKLRGIYAVKPSTKKNYRQTYGDMLTQKQIREVTHEFEKQAYNDIAASVRFKTRQRNSKREWMTYTGDDHVFLRNHLGTLRNVNLKRIKKDYMLNGLTLKKEEYIKPRKDMVCKQRHTQNT